ncbi:MULTISPECIES: thermonuclease family protein [Oceanobacillus]|uniref:TNase-like domain-containing protein n=1 Tax=Oceanobacillus kimchii TaxID=746691 RepID=A0ABQ5TNT5_9BACI|nr:thermonuclease family protein [Oceanobacillus kimchii]GLO68468.1 hypothetical protein MACH08_42520 [Oceanobacillus kimchii]
MRKQHKFILVFCLQIIILAACSSTPNSLGIVDDTEKEWEKSLSSLLPQDPVPNEIKLEDGDYVVANIATVRDGDTLTISNIDTSFIKNVTTQKAIEDEINSSDNATLGVRLISIDTPEITNGKNELFGTEAKEAVERLVYNGEVYLEIDPKALFDNYDRLIAHAYTTEGISIQKTLLSNGLARTAYLYDDYKYINEYQLAEEQAKTKKQNIYSIDGYVKEEESGGFDMSVSPGGY